MLQFTLSLSLSLEGSFPTGSKDGLVALQVRLAARHHGTAPVGQHGRAEIGAAAGGGGGGSEGSAVAAVAHPAGVVVVGEI